MRTGKTLIFVSSPRLRFWLRAAAKRTRQQDCSLGNWLTPPLSRTAVEHCRQDGRQSGPGWSGGIPCR